MIQVAGTPNLGGGWGNNNNKQKEKKPQTLSNIKTCPISQTLKVYMLLDYMP